MLYSKSLSYFYDKSTRVLIRSQPKFKSLEDIWAPFLFLMKTFGLYHYKENCKWWKNIYKFQSCIVLFLSSGMFIFYTVKSSFCVNFVEPAYKFECIVDMVWMVDVTGYAASLFIASHQSSKLKALHHKWMDLHQVTNICQVQHKIRRQMIFITLFMCILIPLSLLEIAVYKIGRGRAVYAIAVNLILQCVEFLSLGFFVLVSTTLVSIISHTNSQFLKFLKNPTKSPRANWDMCRSAYVQLFELIEIADNVLSFPIGWAILCSLTQLTFLSFIYVLYNTSSTSKLISALDSAFWTLILISSLFTVLWKASAVNNELHSMYPHLSKLKIGHFPLSMQNELIFLQNRLGNATIGISAFKVHLITRYFASSIASAYLTYLIILLQFRDSK